MKGVQLSKEQYPEGIIYNVRPGDIRIKSYFEICNVTRNPPVVLPIIAMADGGSCGHLTLPACKIDMLGLTPIAGKAGKTSVKEEVRGAVSVKLVFEPFVVVKFYFVREGMTDVESREVVAIATCHETDYVQYMTEKATVGTDMSMASLGYELNEATKSVDLPVTPIPPSDEDIAAAPTTLPASAIAQITLSPAYHRPLERPDQQVALGQQVLGELAVHADFANSVLWVEEEVPAWEY